MIMNMRITTVILTLAAAVLAAGSCGKDGVDSKGQKFSGDKDIISLKTATTTFTTAKVSFDILKGPDGHDDAALEYLKIYLGQNSEPVSDDFYDKNVSVSGKSYSDILLICLLPGTRYQYSVIAKFEGTDREFKVTGEFKTKDAPTMEDKNGNKHPYMDLGYTHGSYDNGLWALYDVGSTTVGKGGDKVSSDAAATRTYAETKWGSNWETPSMTMFDDLWSNTTRYGKVSVNGGIEGIFFVSKKNNESIFMYAGEYYVSSANISTSKVKCYYYATPNSFNDPETSPSGIRVRAKPARNL